jgi:putative ABC transport system permease protein
MAPVTWREWLTRLRNALLGSRSDDDLREELSLHVELATADPTRTGSQGPMDQITPVMDVLRDQRGLPSVDGVIRDLAYGWRALRRRPTYAVLSVLTLALGIGSTTAVYGVVRSVLFDPLPFRNEDAVGVFWKKTDWTHQEYLHVRGQVPGFSKVALYRRRDVILRYGDEPIRLVPSVTASAELLEVLGADPALGHGFRSGDDVPGAEPVAVLSFGLWQELGGTPAILGTRVTLDGIPRIVIGVMPRGFWFPDPSVRLWIPEPLTPKSQSNNSTLIGRVGPGQSVGAMEAPVAQLVAMLGERFDYPVPRWDKTKDPHITPLREDVLGPMRPALRATLGAIALILLIGCANVAALVLGQVNARSAEFAIRAALGADRRRLIQQLIIEVLFVAGVAGAAGAALAWVGAAVVIGALPLGAWGGSVALDWRAFASAVVIASSAAVLVMLVPAVSLYRADLRGVLHGTRPGATKGSGRHLESGLVMVQVALAMMLAAGAALLARSVTNLYAVDPGVRAEGAAVIDVVLRAGPDRALREQTLDALTMALRELPGVDSAGAVQTLPLRGGLYRLELRVPERPDLERTATEYRIVTPGYLESVGIAVRRGRTITDADSRNSERVVVINEAFALKYFGEADPLDKVISDINAQTPARIVGVVGNAAEKRLTDPPEPVRYAALAQMPWMDDTQSVVVRTTPGVDETSLLEPARQAIARVAPSAAVQQTTRMRRVLDLAIGPARQIVMLLSLMTALAFILAAVGVYGVIAQFAARRRRDWAIRVALGLSASRVVAHVIRHGALLVIVGIGIGVAGASMLTRLLSSFLYGVRPGDTIAFAISGATLLAVGTLAALLPAWRAGRADPLIALREQ